MALPFHHATTIRRTTWLGRVAHYNEFRYGSGGMYGHRVIVWRWEDGETEFKACRGDGRSPTFTKFENAIFKPGEKIDIEEQAAAMAARHF